MPLTSRPRCRRPISHHPCACASLRRRPRLDESTFRFARLRRSVGRNESAASASCASCCRRATAERKNPAACSSTVYEFLLAPSDRPRRAPRRRCPRMPDPCVTRTSFTLTMPTRGSRISARMMSANRSRRWSATRGPRPCSFICGNRAHQSARAISFVSNTSILSPTLTSVVAHADTALEARRGLRSRRP